MVLQQLRHRHAEREGGEGEVKPLQAQRRQPEQKPATRHTPPAAGTTAQYGAPALSMRIAAQ